MQTIKSAGKVLIIENNPTFRAALTEYLSPRYAVQQAYSVLEGLASLEKFPADVILLDQKLIESQSQNLLGRIRQQAPASTSIILLSTEIRLPDAVAAIKGGATDFVAKPIDPAMLDKIVEQNVKQARQRQSFSDLHISSATTGEPAPWCFSGDLEKTAISDLLQFLAFSRMTGTLEVNCGIRTTKVFFLDGEVLSAGSSDPRFYLGQFFIRRGIINEEKLVDLVKKQSEENLLLGKLLIVEGIADEQTVTDVLIAKITETVTSLFLENKGIYTFYQNVVPPFVFQMVNVPLMGLIMQGEVKREEWEKIQKDIPPFTAIAEALVPLDKLPANEENPVEVKIRSMLDGNHTIDEILLETHTSEWDLFSYIHPFYENGVLRFWIDPSNRTDSVWEKILTDQSLEKARRFLIAGEYEKAIRLLNQLVKQPTCDWNLTLPILEDAERQYVDWFYKDRMARSDVPYLYSFQPYPAMDANQNFLIQRIDGVRSLQALIEISPMREIEVLLAIQHFMDLRMIGTHKPESRLSPGTALPGPAGFYALQQLLHHLPFGILSVDISGLVIHANECFLQMSKLKAVDVINQSITRIFNEQILTGIADNYEREFSWTGLDGKSALRRQWLYSVHRFPSAAEGTLAIVLVRDISDMRTKQLNQFRKDRLTSLGEFVAGMTHQLKNPIMMLDTGVKLLGEEKLSEEEIADVANRMKKNVDRMRTLISDILSYVAMDESGHTWINLNGLIEKTIALLREQIQNPGILLEFKPMADPPVIRGNETQIREVLINLISNAMQAIGQEGRIEISTDIQEELEGGVYKNYLLMVVSDTGPGMDPSVIEKLFTPFFTTKPGGKGLGLAFAKRIVEEQGGFIRCWSKVGIGTHFYVYFRIGEL